MKPRRAPIQPFPADAAKSPRRRAALADGLPAPLPRRVEPAVNRALLGLAVATLLAVIGASWWLLYRSGAHGASTRLTLPVSRPVEYPQDRFPYPLASDAANVGVDDRADLAHAPGLPAPDPQIVLPAIDGPVIAAAPLAAGPQPGPVPARRKGSPVLIFDAGDAAAGDSGAAYQGSAPQAAPAPAITAPLAARKSSASVLTRGTMIPAVLESTMDRSAPGGVRAVVTADVRSFDGKRVLVPRSSKLVGQYRTSGTGADARTYVIWTSMDRPDGATVALGSVAGKVAGNSDKAFLESFGSARVQSIVSGGDTARTRTGEPIRVYASGDVDVAKGS